MQVVLEFLHGQAVSRRALREVAAYPVINRAQLWLRRGRSTSIS